MKALSLLGIILSPTAILMSILWIAYVKNLFFMQSEPFLQEAAMQREIAHSIEMSGINAARISILLMIFFIGMFIVSLLKIKINSVKTIGVVGIILSIFMICWSFVMMGSPSVITFDKVAFYWIAYFVMILSCSIYLLIQRNKFIVKSKKPELQNVLDDFDFD